MAKSRKKPSSRPGKKVTKSTATKAGGGKKTTKKSKAAPIPKGFGTLTPHLVVNRGAEAIEFYKKAFGAKVKGSVMTSPDGKVMHAELKIGDTMVMLADDFPEMSGGKARTPQALGNTPVTLHLYVRNADKAFQQAVAAGCETTMPLEDMFWGDRYGQVKDPYGHHWAIATHQEDLSAKKIMKRAAAMFGPVAAAETA